MRSGMLNESPFNLSTAKHLKWKVKTVSHKFYHFKVVFVDLSDRQFFETFPRMQHSEKLQSSSKDFLLEATFE